MAEDDIRKLTFDFMKSKHFRVVHSDGVIGGPTPQGLFAMNFFSERFPIPQQVSQPILPSGALGPELQEMRVTREAIVREVEACIIMNFNQLSRFHKWLGESIEKFASMQAQETATPND